MTLPARLPLFVAASLALTLTPGPAVLFIVARSIGAGRRAGLLSVAGVGLGNAVHAAATALGLAALVASAPVAFAALRFGGAAYLLYLALRKLTGREPSTGDLVAAAPPAGGAVFGQALLVALLNPKTILFFLAFLPQFADPARGSLAAQLLLLGLLFVVVAVATDSLYVLLAGAIGALLRRHPGFGAWERRISALVYAGLAALAAFAGTGGPRAS
jgi:threonine/homoserine/homoserine lactone efflux protein